MSGFSDNRVCPICGNDTYVSMDTEPYDMVTTECVTCGFHAFTKTERLTLDEILEGLENDKMNETGEELSAKEIAKITKEYNKYNGVDFDNV